MTEFDVLRTAADGMDAQRAALDVAARNVAAAQAAPNGDFARLVPQFVLQDQSDDDSSVTEASEPQAPFDASFEDISGAGAPGEDDATHVIRFAGTQRQTGADVDAVTEMVAVLNAQRAYEANASVFDTGKRLMERTIDVGRT
ncbi:MAG TPA: flagellar basal body rod C-terminal domain-containing protein [Candidatus Baltobacteraceae bacterium]